VDAMTDALKRRLAKLTADFSKKHPARAAARKFVHTLVAAKRRGAVSTRRDRERDRATDDLSGYFGMLDDLLGQVFDIVKSPKIEDRAFTLLRQSIETAVALGRLSAPPHEGSSGRDAQHESASAKFVALTQAIVAYHERNLELKVTSDYARIIRPAMLDAFGLPENSNGRVWPTVSAITKALSAVRNRTLKIQPHKPESKLL